MSTSEVEKKRRAEVAARVLCLGLCNCGKFYHTVPLEAHAEECLYRVTVTEGLAEMRAEEAAKAQP